MRFRDVSWAILKDDIWSSEATHSSIANWTIKQTGMNLLKAAQCLMMAQHSNDHVLVPYIYTEPTQERFITSHCETQAILSYKTRSKTGWNKPFVYFPKSNAASNWSRCIQFCYFSSICYDCVIYNARRNTIKERKYFPILPLLGNEKPSLAENKDQLLSQSILLRWWPFTHMD